MAKQAQASKLTIVPPDEKLAADERGLVVPEEEPERSALAKAGIGAGAALVTGLLGYGVYRLGVMLGWWGASSGGIVIDDPSKPDEGGGGSPDVKPSPAPDGGGGGGGGSKSGTRASGNPPNSSNDPAGYNTNLYPSPSPVRLGFKLLGYAIPVGTTSLNPNLEPNPEVAKFQREWNRVIKGIDRGYVKLPASPTQPVWIDRLRGLLDTDGIAGKNTLNALEIAVANHARNLNWRDAVKQAGAVA